MALDLSVDFLADVTMRALYTLRVELAFLFVLGLLYLTGRCSQPPLASKERCAKKDQPAATALKGRPVAEWPGRTRRTARAGPGGGEHPKVAAETGAAAVPRPVAGAKPAQLCDPAWLVPVVLQLCRTQVQQALETYRAALNAGLKLSELPLADCRQLFTALVTSSIRVGQTDDAVALLREVQEQGPGVGAGLLASAAKLCTSKQYFAECLAVYDVVAGDPTVVIDDRSVWSCLLFCAVEAKSYQRCNFFFQRLKAAGRASPKDYGNMIRFASTMGDSDLALTLVQEMREGGVEIDSVVYNTALATCVGADNVEQARALLEEMEQVGGLADVITYNTLAKGYAKAGLMDRCFELFEHMRARGIAPSQVTYGILLDGCINVNRVDRAAEVYESMTREGCPMNTVLYTTLIKGFARSGQVDQSMRVYRQMRSEGSMPPDLITFSILIKANCDAGQLEEALKLLEAMVDLKLRPDEVIFNNLLGGCVKESNAELAKRLYQDMTASGIRPSNATFSILIRLYAQCKLLDEAVGMLRTEPEAWGVSPEPRLFSQLVLCCLRERQGRRAIEVYRLMLGHSAPTVVAHSSMLGMCVKLNMLDTGVEILSLAAQANGCVDERDANAILGAAVRKRKTQCADACTMAMKRLGIACSAASA